MLELNRLHVDQPPLKVNLRQAICALTEALNLVGIDEQQHGERVAYIAVEIARRLDWDERAIDDIFLAGMLHDCGVSSTRVHKSLISEMDWDGAVLHCVVGAYYLSHFRPTAHLAPVIRYHHTHWPDFERIELKPHTPLAANLIFLADRIDVVRAREIGSGLIKPAELARAVPEVIDDFTTSHFAPVLVDAFNEVATDTRFWEGLEPAAVSRYVDDMARGGDTLTGFDDIHQLSQIFARIVDAKSDYTYNHSVGVASLARHLATLVELPPLQTDMIEIAALLHDLGKLGVPDELLEKPAPLNAAETEVMQRHSYETFRILRRIDGFESVAEWAGNHHETLLGDGYPFRHSHSELSLEARIIAISDIFQALIQDRPYRKGLDAQCALGVLQEMAHEGKVDPDVVAMVAENLDSCWHHATTPRDDWPLLQLT